MKIIAAFLCLVALTRAQVPNFGWCPDYLPMADFDLGRFLGKWYEAERYFQFNEIATRCVVTDYAEGPSGKIYISNEVTNRLTGVKRIIGGNLDLVGKTGEGKFKVRYQTTPIAQETTLTVLDTDYDTYAVVWSCSGFGPIHTQSAWVMTRERLAPGTTLQRAYGVLDKYKIARTFFVRTDQEGCALAASDINAANGISPESTVSISTGSDQKGSEKSAPLGQDVKVGPIAEEAKPLKVAEVLLKSSEEKKVVVKEEKPKKVEAKKGPVVEEAPKTQQNIVHL